MDGGVAALLGALIGGLISWLATWSIEVRRDRRQGQSLAVGAASEIEATLAMLRLQNWRGLFESGRDHARAGSVRDISIHVRDEYFPMSRAALAHAGVIDRELARQIAYLLTIADSITSDLKRLSDHPLGSPQALLDSADPVSADLFYVKLIFRLDHGLLSGDEIVERVKQIYPTAEVGWRVRIASAANKLLSNT